MTDLRAGAQQALEALIDAANVLSAPMFADAADALRTALAQPEQEPVPEKEWVYGTPLLDAMTQDYVPAQRPWQGLTDEEIWSVVSRIGTSDSNVNPLTVLSDARAIEQRLKERNHD